MPGRSERIRTRILVPIGLALALVLGVSIFIICRNGHQRINDQFLMAHTGVEKLFSTQLHEDSQLLSKLISIIENNPALQQEWANKDRDALLKTAKPIFQDISSKYRITHFYFINLDRTCFLRVHKPSEYGDFIDRFTLSQAQSQGVAASGIELGTFGTFTLRVVHPWRVNGKLVGYIELGEEIEHITQRLSSVFDVELLFAIDKRYLDRQKWQQGMEMMNKTGQWDQFSNFVIIDKTMKTISPELVRAIEMNAQQGKITQQTIKDGQRKYREGSINLFDAGQRNLGNIIVLSDITLATSAMRSSAAGLIGICVVTGGILMVLFYWYLGKIENRLIFTLDKLNNEIRERKLAEKDVLEISDRQRREIGQNLHDGLIQHLSSVAFLSELLTNDLKSNSIKQWPKSAELNKLICDSIDQARGVTRGLFPVELEVGLTSALEELARDTSKLYPVQCSFRSHGYLSSPDIEFATHIYRIVQEAVNNCVKHAQASNIIIEVLADIEQTKIRIVDDGKGINDSYLKSSIAQKGLGFRTMKYRADMINGQLDIYRSEHGGTIVNLSFTNPQSGSTKSDKGGRSKP